MAGERLIQVIDIGRFRAIRPALDELDAARALGLESHAVLQEAAASPFAHSKSRLGFAMLVGRILRHPELELRVFLEPRELDRVIEGVMHVLCFENGAESSLVTPVGPSWVVLDRALAVFGDLDWFRAIFDPNLEERQLPYPRGGFEGRYSVLSREDLARVAAALQPLLDDPIPTEIATLLATRADQRQAQHTQDVEQLQSIASHIPEVRAVIEALYAGSSLDDLVLVLSQEVRPGAEGLARLAAKALSREELTLAHASLL